MKKSTIFATILSAATLAVASAGLAAGPAPGSNGGADTELWTAPAVAGQPILWMPSGSTDPRAHSIAKAKPSPSPYSLAPPTAIGMDLISAQGESIGKVVGIAGIEVIASVGTHDVALSWPQLRPTGAGDAMKLQTTLSKDQVRTLPQFKK